MARRIRDPESRTRIIEVTWRVVAEHGLQGATMRTIAAAAGVTTGYVTHYFEDKDQLLREVLRYNNELAGARIQKVVREARGLAGLKAAAEAVLPLDADGRRFWQVWVAFWTASTEDGFAEGLNEGRREWHRLLASLLAQAVDDGDLPAAVNLEYEAERLVILLAGMGLISGVTPPRKTRDTATRVLADHLAGLRK